MKSEDEQRLKEVVIYSAIGLGTAAGLFFAGRHAIKKLRENNAQKDTLEQGDPATYAKQLRMAFANDNLLNWGTNEELIFSVFNEIPTKAIYNKVQREYTKLYNRSLNADLEDELSADEYNEVIRILSSKS